VDAQACRLENEALLHINGPDTLTFLQGQTTCDSRELSPERALPGAYCTPQGRVVCDFLLVQLGADHVALRMRAEIVEHAAAVLGKYIVFSKADIDIGRDDWQVFGCWGRDAAKVLDSVLGGAPGGRYSALTTEHAIAVQLDDDGELFECHINVAQAPRVAEQLLDAATAAPEQGWRAAQIARGVARIESGTVEVFVPQSLNYDLTGHISFKKGCYTGQEVVARLHYRGTPKRRAYLASLARDSAGDNVASAGDKVFSPDSGSGVGEVVNVADDGDRLLLLVSASVDAVAAGLRLQGADGPELALLEQPYPVAQG
jgi:folate-binding protein YgfZ